MNDPIENTVETEERHITEGKEMLVKLQTLCSGKLFLAVCIAHTCGALYTMILLPYAVLSLIISVGLWLIYGFSRKGILKEKAFAFRFLSVPMLIFQILITVLLIALLVCFVAGAVTCIFSTHEKVIDGLSDLLSSFQWMPDWVPMAADGLTWTGMWTLVYLFFLSLIVYLPLQIACTFFGRGRKLFSSVYVLADENGFSEKRTEKRFHKQLRRFGGSLVALGIVCCFVNLPMAIALFIAHAAAEQAQDF